MNIEFSCDPSLWRIASPPYRASKSLPLWWKKLERHLPVGDDRAFPGYSYTVKACTPVFDAMTAGYIIPLPFDLHIKSASNSQVEFHWRYAPGDLIEPHAIEQAPAYDTNAWKLINPWMVWTPPGYSVLVTHPLHRPDLPFHTMEAVVDTDRYRNRINFPFLWEGGVYEDVLRAGTPFAQVIPFKRESWTMNVHAETPDEQQAVHIGSSEVQANEHAYRRFTHVSKSYKEASDA